MEFAPRLETPRLVLSQLALTDAPEIQAVFPQWSIVAYMAATVPWPYPDDGALTHVRDNAIPAMEAGFEWHWCIRPKSEPRRLIGMVSLMLRDDDNRGFWLDPSWQRLGLMREASDTVTDFWFDRLGRSLLRVPKASANASSRAISERSGT
jgi:[ribosomal protein S5]-alanine N-acetyltransferase